MIGGGSQSTQTGSGPDAGDAPAAALFDDVPENGERWKEWLKANGHTQTDAIKAAMATGADAPTSLAELAKDAELSGAVFAALGGTEAA